MVITHAFKADWVYDLPFGDGRAFFSSIKGLVGKVLEGWAFQGTARIQSGSPFNINNVRLIGMKRNERGNIQFSRPMVYKRAPYQRGSHIS